MLQVETKWKNLTKKFRDTDDHNISSNDACTFSLCATGTHTLTVQVEELTYNQHGVVEGCCIQYCEVINGNE